jgi:HAD superfamily hydrolase (TIGR01509 family)
MIRAVLWDNDGVLVDSETVFFEVTRTAFARLGLVLTKELWGTQYLGEGRSTRDIARSLGASPADIAPVIDKRNEQYRSMLEYPPAIRPKVPEILGALSGRVRMAIVTGCHRDELYLMHASSGLLRFFDTVITGDDYDDPKPKPGPYLAAVKAMDLDAKACIAVEDSQRGLVSATTAGISCMIVPTGLSQMHDFSGALSVEHDVSGILQYVRVGYNR